MLHCVGVDGDDALGMEEGIEPLSPHAPLDCFVIEVVEFLRGSSFLGAPHGGWILLVALKGGHLLVRAHSGFVH